MDSSPVVASVTLNPLPFYFLTLFPFLFIIIPPHFVPPHSLLVSWA